MGILFKYCCMNVCYNTDCNLLHVQYAAAAAASSDCSLQVRCET